MSVNAPPRIVIATRESRLALWQAEHVKALLQSRGAQVELLGMTTQGDQILDRSLSKVGYPWRNRAKKVRNDFNC